MSVRKNAILKERYFFRRMIMRLNKLTDEQIKLLPKSINLRDLIYIQKESIRGTKALNSVILNDFNIPNKTVSVTIQRLNSEFDDLTSQLAKRQSFIGRINDNLNQLLPEYNIDVTWLSGFDEPYCYNIKPLKD